MNSWPTILSGDPLSVLSLLALLVLLYEPANRNAVRLLRAWKRPRGK